MPRPSTLQLASSNDFTPSDALNQVYIKEKATTDSQEIIIDDNLPQQQDEDQSQQPQLPKIPTYTPPQPSVSLLFCFCSRRDIICVLIPSAIISVIAGGVAPFMTLVLSQGFDAFSTFSVQPQPPSQAVKNKLLHDVGIAALELVALAIGAVALSSFMSSLWILVGERNVLGLKRYIYRMVTTKDMEWFDLNMRVEKNTSGDEPAEGTTTTSGAAGLMAKFAKETDEVRTASSLTSGIILQNFVTVLACLVLAFRGSWSLTLVIFSTVPVMMVIQGFAQRASAPYLTIERNLLAQCADHCDRSFKTIATVKAFNAEEREFDQLEYFLNHLKSSLVRLYMTWGFTNGLSQFVVMSTFVTGFWFGSKLVRDGTASPGQVMGVFWAVLIATNNLQLVLPHFITLARGKESMVALMTLVHTPVPPRPQLPPPSTTDAGPMSPTFVPLHPEALSHNSQSLRKIIPSKPCAGEFALRNVTFAYPSRPLQPVLRDVSLYIPACETTYIVGSSGSGKSTIAALLSRLYTPQYGTIEVDDQVLSHLDLDWTRSHIFHVSQSCILFPGSVHDNVAMGLAGSPFRQPGEESRAEVIAACRASLMHEFVRDLPDGYDTIIGTGGEQLSGGQRQRLAIARARLRDPTVLILDECTSALDPTSRILVFEALKRWRRNRTTIVITHDLSQITYNDFVYVLKDGAVAEQGYRADLENNRGEFWRMSAHGELNGDANDSDRGTLSDVVEVLEDDESHHRIDIWTDNDMSLAVNGFRSVSRASGNWAGIAGGALEALRHSFYDEDVEPEEEARLHPNRRVSALRPSSRNLQLDMHALSVDLERGDTVQADTSAVDYTGEAYTLAVPSPVYSHPHERRANIEYTPTSAYFHRPLQLSIPASPPSQPPLSHLAAQLQMDAAVAASPRTMSDSRSITSQTETVVDIDIISDLGERNLEEDAEFDEEKRALERSAAAASTHRHVRNPSGFTKEMRAKSIADSDDGRTLRSIQPTHKKQRVKILSSKKTKQEKAPATPEPVKEPVVPLRKVLWNVYRFIPSKILLFFGMLCCVISGAMTPLFSFLLSKLLFEVSIGARDVSTINMYGAIILAVALADGVFNGLKYIAMELSSLGWITELRKTVYTRILKQDKRWFDKAENGSEKLVHTLFKDGEDAKQLIGQILGQSIVVCAMLGLGLIWAMVLGWQLTLAGFAIGPIFAGVMSVQATLVDKFQRRNRECREEVAKGYYETISNIRGIRSMAFEGIFRDKYEKSLSTALRAGVKGAFIEGCNVGVASGLIYLAEGLLFWVGAVLVARQIYSYQQMVQVLQLVVFSVSIASQLLAFTGGISKALQATRDLDKLLALSLKTEESHGELKPDIEGRISFKNVHFAYPERPTVPILRGLSLDIQHGECVAIVGGSGSGKSTIISLLQRLYGPTSGSITVEGTNLGETDVTWLRDHISIVSQNPNLFDMTVIDNIAYGSHPLPDEDCYLAARACNAEEFILNLPDAYETQLGDNADLLSGGQAQRLAIARALVRGARVLVLDECTSALDAENQAFVMESIRKVKEGRTTIMITHKLPIMRMCDRILVVHDGVIAEEGTYDSLLERRGVFSQLASGGEWSPE